MEENKYIYSKTVIHKNQTKDFLLKKNITSNCMVNFSRAPIEMLLSVRQEINAFFYLSSIKS